MANQFLPFGTGSGANVLDQSEYSALAARLPGFTAGVAKSAEANKVWRQATIASYLIGEFISANGLDALDDADLTTLFANFRGAFRRQSLNYVPLVGGTANALTATLDPAPASYAALIGTPFRVLIAATNTAAATLNLNGLGALPIQTQRGGAVARGDLPSGGVMTLICTGTAFVLAGVAYSEVPLLGSPTIYVRTDGNDNNDGSANDSSHALATIPAAISRLSNYASSATPATIQLGNAGTYAAPGTIAIAGSLNIVGNESSPTTYIVSLSTGDVSSVGVTAGTVTLKGIGLRSASASIVPAAASGSGILNIQNAYIWNSVSVANFLTSASYGGLINLGAGVVFNSSATAALRANAGGIVEISGAISWNAGFTYSVATASAGAGGIITLTASGSATGSASGSRYSATSNAVINTNGGGANYFPGDTAGTTATGGQYV